MFLDKALFSTFVYTGPTQSDDEDEDFEAPSFQVSLSALLETLQIFGFSDSTSRFRPDGGSIDYTSNIRPGRPNAFSNATLNISGTCRLSYLSTGSPLSIVLEESGVTTTCNLHTYTSEYADEIPFDRSDVACKIIMQARFLFDAVAELSTITNTSSTSTSKVSVLASPYSPYLSLSAAGPLGSAIVEFGSSRELLETFSVFSRWTQSYKFEMIKATTEALRLGSKVSLRGDGQGVLSLQVMIEHSIEGGQGSANVSFVDFRFVPFVSGEDDESTGEEEGVDENDDETFNEELH